MDTIRTVGINQIRRKLIECAGWMCWVNPVDPVLSWTQMPRQGTFRNRGPVSLAKPFVPWPSKKNMNTSWFTEKNLRLGRWRWSSKSRAWIPCNNVDIGSGAAPSVIPPSQHKVGLNVRVASYVWIELFKTTSQQLRRSSWKALTMLPLGQGLHQRQGRKKSQRASVISVEKFRAWHEWTMLTDRDFCNCFCSPSQKAYLKSKESLLMIGRYLEPIAFVVGLDPADHLSPAYLLQLQVSLHLLCLQRWRKVNIAEESWRPECQKAHCLVVKYTRMWQPSHLLKTQKLWQPDGLAKRAPHFCFKNSSSDWLGLSCSDILEFQTWMLDLDNDSGHICCWEAGWHERCQKLPCERNLSSDRHVSQAARAPGP